MTNTNVETAVMSDLGMDKVTRKFRDPRPKMEQRHQMVCPLLAAVLNVYYHLICASVAESLH